MKFPSYAVLFVLLNSVIALPAPPGSADDVENAPTKNWYCGKRMYAPKDILVAQHFAVGLQNAGETRAPSNNGNRPGYPNEIKDPSGVPGLPTDEGELQHYPILFPATRGAYNGKAAIGDDRVVYTYTKGAAKSKFIALITHTGAPQPGAFILCKEGSP